MHIRHIAGFTRVIGEQQGYIGLPIRDIVVDDPVTGPNTPAMESAWPLDDADRAAIAAGGDLILRVVGKGHPPVMLYVDEIGAPADQSDVHNDLAGRLVKAIVRPALLSGGSLTDVMVLTESVLLGVCLSCVRFGGDEKALDIITRNVRQRLAELRLGDIQTAGSA
jgi:hypothetical protein